LSLPEIAIYIGVGLAFGIMLTPLLLKRYVASRWRVDMEEKKEEAATLSKEAGDLTERLKAENAAREAIIVARRRAFEVVPPDKPTRQRKGESTGGSRA
jgi:hypothetical protein